MAPFPTINFSFEGKLLRKLCVAILGKKFIKEEKEAITDAHRHHMLMLAQTEKDVEAIKNGELDYSQRILMPTQSTESSKLNLQQESVLREIGQDILFRELQRRHNLGHIQAHALIEAKDVSDKEVSEEEVDEDWMTRFCAYGADVSNEKLQEIWGRLLAGEVKRPGSFSLKTLEILKILNTVEAAKIEKIASFRLDNLIFMPTSRASFYSRYNFKYQEFLDLEELGILSLKEGHHKELKTGSLPFETLWRCNGKGLYIKIDDKPKELRVPGYLLSKAGTQIMDLAKVIPNIDYLREVGTYIKKTGADVSIVDYQIFQEPDQVSMSNFIPI